MKGDAPSMITVKGLTIGWPPVILMKDMSFTIRRGEVFVILGGSGCGKSTLLRHLIGLEQAISGTIDIAGVGAPELDPGLDRGAPPYGVTFQSGALFGSLTLFENTALPLRRWTNLEEPAIDAIVRARLALVGLDGFENHLPSEISGGMKKRAAIARALALDPPILFLDEPSAGLDPISAVELDDLMRMLADRFSVTLVLVTHELESVFRVADRCIMLDKGSQGAIAEGDPRKLRDGSEDPRVRAFFNREPQRTV